MKPTHHSVKSIKLSMVALENSIVIENSVICSFEVVRFMRRFGPGRARRDSEMGNFGLRVGCFWKCHGVESCRVRLWELGVLSGGFLMRRDIQVVRNEHANAKSGSARSGAFSWVLRRVLSCFEK